MKNAIKTLFFVPLPVQTGSNGKLELLSIFSLRDHDYSVPYYNHIIRKYPKNKKTAFIRIYLENKAKLTTSSFFEAGDRNIRQKNAVKM